MMVFSLLGFAVFLTVAVGWVMNIYALTGMSLDPITTELVLRCVGIVMVPLGAVMGLFF